MGQSIQLNWIYQYIRFVCHLNHRLNSTHCNVHPSQKLPVDRYATSEGTTECSECPAGSQECKFWKLVLLSSFDQAMNAHSLSSFSPPVAASLALYMAWLWKHLPSAIKSRWNLPGRYSELVGATSLNDCIPCPSGTFSISESAWVESSSSLGFTAVFFSSISYQECPLWFDNCRVLRQWDCCRLPGAMSGMPWRTGASKPDEFSAGFGGSWGWWEHLQEYMKEAKLKYGPGL